MNIDRLILTPIAAALLRGIFVGFAILGGTLANGSTAIATKTDRFATKGDTLCAGQTWPNLSVECLVWVEGTPLNRRALHHHGRARTGRADHRGTT